MPAQPPYKVGNSFNTPLDSLDEAKFRQWLVDNKVPFNPNVVVSDYDMRGYWQAHERGQPMAADTQMNANDGKPHYTDYYKTPFHQTFSQDSQWSEPNSPFWFNDHQLGTDNGRVLYDEKNPPHSILDYLRR